MEGMSTRITVAALSARLPQQASVASTSSGRVIGSSAKDLDSAEPEVAPALRGSRCGACATSRSRRRVAGEPAGAGARRRREASARRRIRSVVAREHEASRPRVARAVSSARTTRGFPSSVRGSCPARAATRRARDDGQDRAVGDAPGVIRPLPREPRRRPSARNSSSSRATRRATADMGDDDQVGVPRR